MKTILFQRCVRYIWSKLETRTYKNRSVLHLAPIRSACWVNLVKVRVKVILGVMTRGRESLNVKALKRFKFDENARERVRMTLKVEARILLRVRKDNDGGDETKLEENFF